MIVFDLICSNSHSFEGWFASADAFDGQLRHKLVSCPICADSAVQRKPSRVNIGSTAAAESPANDPGARVNKQREAFRQFFAEFVRTVVESTEDVGRRFPEEARRIHYNEVPARNIRGVASTKEAQELREEGIEVTQIALPVYDELH